MGFAEHLQTSVSNMSIKLSIIIPVFNDEKNIERCLKSVFEQDISADEYEVIVVNDGSYDGTQSIVEVIQVRHKNLFLINTENRKLGAARNTGIKYSNGKYILFLDSDDYIKNNVLNIMLCEVEFNDLDILFSDYYNQDNSGGELLKNMSYVKNNLFTQSGIEFIKKTRFTGFLGFVCIKKVFLLKITSNIEKAYFLRMLILV